MKHVANSGGILGHAMTSLEDGNNDYMEGLKHGHAAALKVAIGKRFTGAFGYANHYAGSSDACRASAAWRGAAQGYLNGMTELGIKSVTVDVRGFAIAINQ